MLGGEDETMTYESYMAAKEVAIYLKIHLHTVYRRINKKGADKLPHVRIGGSIRFNKDAIYNWRRIQNFKDKVRKRGR